MTLDDLREYGANVDEGLARCLGNEEFYLRLVASLKGDAGFDALKSALEAHDLEGAFAAAHSLKGSLGNLSLTPLYEPVYEITELLRTGTEMDYSEIMATIEKRRDELFALM